MNIILVGAFLIPLPILSKSVTSGTAGCLHLLGLFHWAVVLHENAFTDLKQNYIGNFPLQVVTKFLLSKRNHLHLFNPKQDLCRKLRY